MDVGRVRAAGASLVTLALLGLAASPALAAPGVSVSELSSLKAGANAGTLTGKVVNDSGRATRAEVAVRVMRRGTHHGVIGRTTVKVAAHGSAGYRVAVKLPAGLTKGNYYLSACTANGTGAGGLGCATARDDVLIKGGTPGRGVQGASTLARAAQAPACSAGGRTLAQPASKLYPETGNTGYSSVHTDVNLVYDAPSNLFLPGTHVDLQQHATQCLTEFSLDFERTNAVTDPNVPGPNLSVQSITINGQPATFTFKQPTYPGDPNGQDDPDPLAHAASNSNPVSATNPNPPACAPIDTTAAVQGLQCPATKLVITPAAPIEAGSDFKVVVNYTGRPGVHVDGDGATEGWFRNNTPAGDGGFVTTEPVGTMSWMPLNNHPTVKPTYDFSTTTNWDAATGTGRTAISNGRPVGFTNNAADANFPGGSRTWQWKSSEPIANYLVENSVGNYDRDEYLASSGVLFSHFQASGIAPANKVTNLATMKMQEDIMNFQTQFNGPFPFNADGVVIGLPTVSFAEEMQTKITFQGGRISLGTLNHENMHQWWGDNVSEDRYERTFFKEGYADLSEGYASARTAATTAGGLGTPAGDAAFEASLVTRFNNTYNSTNANSVGWNVAPSNPTNANLFNNQTYVRSGRGYIALRAILGKANFDGASKEIQTTYGGGSITQPQQIAIYKKWMTNKSAACSAKLDEFFKQWWDTAYVGSPAAGNKPQITGPGLAGPGFYDASCPELTNVDTQAGGSVPATLSLTLGAPATFGAFTPGVAKDYTASTTANVISTAGDAMLTYSTPGFMMNGTFALASPLEVTLSKSTWTAPTSNESVAIGFKQHIGANDALRTGTYSKTLTFTLSTTTP
jgi:Peptidase family M1 domain